MVVAEDTVAGFQIQNVTVQQLQVVVVIKEGGVQIYSILSQI